MLLHVVNWIVATVIPVVLEYAAKIDTFKYKIKPLIKCYAERRQVNNGLRWTIVDARSTLLIQGLPEAVNVVSMFA